MPARHHGFTLIETLLVIMILGTVVLIGFPKMSSAMTKTNIRGARTTLINMVAKARTAATQNNRVTWLKVQGNTVLVVAKPRLTGLGDADTLGPVEDLAVSYGVSLATDTDSIRFDPRGLGTGFGAGGATFWISRGDHTDTVLVDGLGRVTK